MTAAVDPIAEAEAALPERRARHAVWRNPGVIFGAAVLLVVALAALLAPHLGTADPILLKPRLRLRPPSALAWLGTDQFGRDVYSRVVYGARVSLIVGFAVSLVAVAIGLAIGSGGSSQKAPPRAPRVAPVPHSPDAAQQARNLAAWLQRYSK